MTGTLINVVAVLIGTGLGLVLGHRLTESMRETVMRGLGLVVLAMGIQMAFETANFLIVLGAMLVGGLLGEWWRLEARLNHLGVWLEARFNRNHDGESSEGAARFIQGFVTASLVYCIGPLAVLGAFQDGLTGDYRLLAIKSMLDGFASLAFASSMGVGVSFAALSVLVYQGGLTLLAQQAQAVLTTEMIAEMTAVGGLLMVGIAISALLEIKPIRVGNFLPALLIAPLIVTVLAALGLPIAPQF
jgi:uncharacterized membrane protein YqgA involved in biofilm formation